MLGYYNLNAIFVKQENIGFFIPAWATLITIFFTIVTGKNISVNFIPIDTTPGIIGA